MFSSVNEIEALICRLMDKLDESRTDSLELTVDDVKIKLARHEPPHFEGAHVPAPQKITVPAMPVTPAANVPVQTASTVNAPLLGVAYAAPAPDAAPFIKVGDKVKKGDVICIIEAMKVMNEIESDKDGTVADILFENGKMVEFGQPLIVLD